MLKKQVRNILFNVNNHHFYLIIMFQIFYLVILYLILNILLIFNLIMLLISYIYLLKFILNNYLLIQNFNRFNMRIYLIFHHLIRIFNSNLNSQFLVKLWVNHFLQLFFHIMISTHLKILIMFIRNHYKLIKFNWKMFRF